MVFLNELNKIESDKDTAARCGETKDKRLYYN
jgi:hypothetical protein